MADQRFRVLAVATHPVQYMAPIFRRMASHPQLERKVAYCSLRGAEASLDQEFGATVKWDVPLLDGYDWVEVRKKGSGAESFFGRYNPSARRAHPVRGKGRAHLLFHISTNLLSSLKRADSRRIAKGASHA